MKKLFTYFTNKNNGYISEEELQKYVKEIGDNMSFEEVSEMIRKLSNKNTSITFTDFKRICKTKIQ